MHAFMLTSFDDEPVLVDVPDPVAGSGEAVVTVLAAGLNPVDTALATRPAANGAVPRVLGAEGIVDLDGRAVYVEHAVSPHGTFAERTVVRPEETIPLPEGLDPVLAIPCGIPGLAAWNSIESVGKLQPGETVLVLGANSAAGQVAVQGAKLLGAGTVVAAGRSRQRLEYLLERGADALVELGSDDDAAALKEATGGGADLIFDALFGPPLIAALSSSKAGARSITMGALAGFSVELPFMALFTRSLLSYTNFRSPHETQVASFSTMAAHAAAGDLVVRHEVVPLSEVASAWKRQLSGADTKLIIRP